MKFKQIVTKISQLFLFWLENRKQNKEKYFESNFIFDVLSKNRTNKYSLIKNSSAQKS